MVGASNATVGGGGSRTEGKHAKHSSMKGRRESSQSEGSRGGNVALICGEKRMNWLQRMAMIHVFVYC
jgi:hypothetical protein